MARMKSSMLDAFIYTENEVMRKQLTHFSGNDAIIQVMVNSTCNSQVKDVRLDLVLNKSIIRLYV